MPDYRELKLNSRNIDTYYALNKKVTLIKERSGKYFKGRLLDIGCGRMPYKDLILNNTSITDYVGLDIENDIYQKEDKPDLFWDGKNMPIDSDSFNCSMLIEVLEHVPQPEIVLNEINRVLREDSYLIITVPFLWNLHDVPNDEYRYTPFALRRILENCNFEVIEMEATGGWHASLATMLGLYVRRALSGKKKRLATFFLKPLISYLHHKDGKSRITDFRKSQMITGLWCVAKVVKN